MLMKSNSISLSLVSLLKACSKQKDICKGIRIHADVLQKQLLGKYPYVDCALVNMYAKCGTVSIAHEVLDMLPFRNSACWCALIVGYTQHGHDKEAFICFEQMHLEGLCPDVVTFMCILKVLSNIGHVDKGVRIHRDIVSRGLLEKSILLGNALVHMYAKCGALATAAQVFDELSIRDVVSWNGLIAGYIQQGEGKEAMNSFEQMQLEGLSPDEVTFTCILGACSSIQAVDKGKQIHVEISVRELLQKNIVVSNALVDMYAKCGELRSAHFVFDELCVRDVVSWSTLISGYSDNELCKEALYCFEQMQCEGLTPDAVAFISILKACGTLKAADKGKQIYNEIVRQELLGKYGELDNALVDMYAKCGLVTKALDLLDRLLIRDIVAWNTLISGYAQQGQGEKALSCYEQMQYEGLVPNLITFICILTACGSTGAVSDGSQIHGELIKQDLLGKSVELGNALIDMYVKCGAFAKAHQVLEDIPVRDVVSWSTLVAEYSRQEQGQEALNCYENMQYEGLSTEPITFACILKACGSIGAADKGEQIHCEIVEQGLLGKDLIVSAALIDMYVKCGLLLKAQKVLDELPAQDAVCWNVLIAGYVEQEQGEGALYCLERMQREGSSPDLVTFACISKACGMLGAASKGKQIHDEIVCKGWLCQNIVLGSALVDMYAKCGALAESQWMLDDLPVRNVVSWNALIAGYSQEVQGEKALNCFERMQHEGLCPDDATFTCVLTACSRTGLVDCCQMCMVNMAQKYGILPSIDHYTSMVDLFGRAGHFDKAIAFLKKISHLHDLPVWSTLLNGCRKWENIQLGKWAFEHALKVDEKGAGPYVSMAHIYAAIGMYSNSDN